MRALAAFVFALSLTQGAFAQEALPNWYQVIGGKWDVPLEVAMDAASAIKASAIDNAPRNRRPMRDISAYTVQYQGVVVDGARLVRLSGACSLWGRTPESLRDGWLVIADGGDCYYDATYDPASKRITSIRAHGHA